MKYLIYSKKHSPIQGAAVWWRPGSAGYTTNPDEAGRYSELAACDACWGLKGEAVKIPEFIVNGLPVTKSIDCNHVIAHLDKS